MKMIPRLTPMSKRSFPPVLLSLLVCGILGGAPTVHGAWNDSLYVELFGGFHQAFDKSITRGGASADASYKGGTMFGGSIGKVLTPQWAAEVEFFYRSNDVKEVKGLPFPGVSEGDLASTNLMFNLTYTFATEQAEKSFLRFTPYIGVGAGFLQEADIDLTVAGREQQYQDSWVPAAQLLVGVSKALSSRWSVFIEARYHYAGEIDLDSTEGNPRVEVDYNGVSGLVGLRRSF